MPSGSVTISRDVMPFLSQIIESGDFSSYYGVIESYGSPYGGIGKEYSNYSGDFWDGSSFQSWVSDRYTTIENWNRRALGLNENKFSDVRSSVQRDLAFEHFSFISMSGELPTTKDIFSMHVDVFDRHGISGSWIGQPWDSDLSLQGIITDFFMGVEPSDPKCFLAGTMIDMWPLGDDLALRPDGNGLYDEAAIIKAIWKKPIEIITSGDQAVSYDGDGHLKPGRVTRIFRNQSRYMLDIPVPNFDGNGRPDGTFASLVVTPGHITYCVPIDGEANPLTGKHVPIVDILENNGAIQMVNGAKVRLASGCVIGSVYENLTEEDVLTAKLKNGEEACPSVKYIVYSAETAHLFEQAQSVASSAGNLAIQPEPIEGWQTYNFEVEELHTYIAGGVRVHNMSFDRTTQPGETLSEIALRFGTSVAALLRDNRHITDPNKIYAGSRLQITLGGKVQSSSASGGSTVSFSTAPGSGGHYAGQSWRDTPTGGTRVFDPSSRQYKDVRGSNAGNRSTDQTTGGGSSSKPVLIDLDGDGLDINTLKSSNFFYDMDGDGQKNRTAWAGAGDGAYASHCIAVSRGIPPCALSVL